MRQGAILEAAKRDTTSGLYGSLFLIALCALVFGWNWRYVYNWFAGPFPLEPAVVTTDDAREWIRLEASQLERTTMVEERTLRLLGLDVSTDVSARYMSLDVGEKGLIVKVDDELSGDVIEGRLEPLPNDLRLELQRSSPIGALHPRLLDATSDYRWDFNLFVLGAGLLAPLAVFALLASIWQSGSAYRHGALRPLKAHGEPQAVIARIEDEMAALGDGASVGPLWVSSDWIVLLVPELELYRVEDLCGVGVTTTSNKNGSVSYQLTFWSRGNHLSKSVDTTATQAANVVQGLSERHSWLVVEDAEDFDMRWTKDRKGTIADIDARRPR